MAGFPLSVVACVRTECHGGVGDISLHDAGHIEDGILRRARAFRNWYRRRYPAFQVTGDIRIVADLVQVIVRTNEITLIRRMGLSPSQLLNGDGTIWWDYGTNTPRRCAPAVNLLTESRI